MQRTCVHFHTHSVSHTHISGYYGVPVQLPVDEIPLLVASSPLAGFKPGSVCPGPRERERQAVYKCDDCCPAFSPALCKKQPMTSLPPTLAPVSASHWPQNGSRNRAASSSRPHLSNLSDVIGNSIKITAAESFTQIIGLSLGQIEEGWEGWRGMVRGS